MADHAADTSFQITRRFQAPIARVFKAYIDPADLRQWWCPEGFRFTNIQVDPKTGRGTRFSMTGGAGDTYTWDMDYQQVNAPTILKWTSTPVDGFGDTGVMHGLLELRETPDGTFATLTQRGYPDAATRDAHKTGSESGFDKLEKFLAKRR